MNPFHLFYQRTLTLISQLTLSEISGSLGDLGTFIPLFVALSHQRSIILSPALFFCGLCNIVTGYSWDVPMCVQPMKSIAAVALADGLSQSQVTCAGVVTGGIVLLMGLSNFIELVNVIVPVTVVSGLQIGIGMKLAGRGMSMVAALEWVGPGVDCILLGLILSLLTLYWIREGGVGSSGSNTAASSSTSSARQNENAEEDEETTMTSTITTTTKRRRQISSIYHNLVCCCLNPQREHPVGIYLFLVGVILATVTLCTTTNPESSPSFTFFQYSPIAVWALNDATRQDWKIGFLEGALPQIPLTTLNSVISVCCLASTLYPEKRRRVTNTSNNNEDDDSSSSRELGDVLTRREVSISVGLMNLLLCPFGAMPNCHGAGGLAGQHRFGARHGASVVFLGFWKCILAVFFGSGVLIVLDAVPLAVLGVMLAVAGVELSKTGFLLMVTGSLGKGGGGGGDGRLDKTSLKRSLMIALITAVVILTLGKTHYGAIAGWVAHMIYGDGITQLWSYMRTNNVRRAVENGAGHSLEEEDDSHISTELSSFKEENIGSERQPNLKSDSRHNLP